MDTPVSICAMGCVCAAGRNTESCFKTMTNGKVAPTFTPPIDLEQDLATPVFAVIPDWLIKTPEHLLTESMKLLLTAADEAFNQAGITFGELKNLRVGTCIGSSTGASLNFKSFYQQWKARKTPDLDIIRSYLHSSPAACLADYYDLEGPTQTVTNACSSGTDAIGIAASWIRQGLCDLVFAGGVDALSSISYTGFSRLMITSPEACRPFDAERKGLNLGEGAGILLLANEKAQKELRLTAQAQVLGYSTYSDAHHLTAPHPEGSGLKKALGDALNRSGLKVEDIGFINTHGTGTENNDRIEGMVLREMFPKIPFTGIKGFTGHTLGAAGAIEAVITVESLRLRELMPCGGFKKEDSQIGISPVSRKCQVDAEYALSDSLAFGGNNSALIFKRGTE